MLVSLSIRKKVDASTVHDKLLSFVHVDVGEIAAPWHADQAKVSGLAICGFQITSSISLHLCDAATWSQKLFASRWQYKVYAIVQPIY